MQRLEMIMPAGFRQILISTQLLVCEVTTMKRGLIYGSAVILLFVLALSSCCDTCPRAGILTVRMINPPGGVEAVRFDVYQEGSDSVEASGFFSLVEAGAGAYAKKDGKIYVFSGGLWDVHVYVDWDNSFDLSTNDHEYTTSGLVVSGDDVLDVDYLDFTNVN
jgi:hypothetical protein